VRLAVPLELGTHIGAVLARFLLEHTRIRIELTFTNRAAEIVGDLVDIGIAVGRLPDSSLVTRRLGEATNKLYAAPSYLARRGQIRTVADLAKHDAIITRSIAGGARWDLSGPRGTERVDVTGRIAGDSMQFVTEAAVAGLGVALMPTFIGDRLTAEGKLTPVLPKFSMLEPLHVLTHGGRHLPRRVALVRDYLHSALAGVCTEHRALNRAA